jgi:hypothetical protein
MKESFPQIERLELNRVLFSLFFSSMGNTMEKSILAYVYFPLGVSKKTEKSKKLKKPKKKQPKKPNRKKKTELTD